MYGYSDGGPICARAHLTSSTTLCFRPASYSLPWVAGIAHCVQTMVDSKSGHGVLFPRPRANPFGLGALTEWADLQVEMRENINIYVLLFHIMFSFARTSRHVPIRKILDDSKTMVHAWNAHRLYLFCARQWPYTSIGYT